MSKYTEVSAPCALCGYTYTTAPISIDAIKRWKNEGLNIQDAMPDVSLDDREFLMSRICPICWEKFEDVE